MKLRPATKEDAKFLFDWRNDTETRQQSRNSAEISWENHLEWLASSLSMAGRKFYLAEQAGIPVGTVRSDIHKDGMVELSWTVAPSHRGKGVGKAMVMQFVQQFHSNATCIAIIQKGNIPSEKIAKALGLYQVGPILSEVKFKENPLMLWQK